MKYLFSRFSSSSACGIYNAIMEATPEKAEEYLNHFVKTELDCRLKHKDSKNDKISIFDISFDKDGEIVGYAEFIRTDGQGVDTFLFQFTPLEEVKEITL